MLPKIQRVYIYIVGLYAVLSVVIYNYYFRNHESSTLINRSIIRLKTDMILYPDEKYNVVANIVSIGEESSTVVDDSSITLCTQTCTRNLHNVKTLAENWDGRLSVAVFCFDADISRCLLKMLLLHECSEEVSRKVCFHIVFPVTETTVNLASIKALNLDCRYLPLLKAQEQTKNFNHGDIPYPIGFLRKIAMMFSTGTFVFNTDVDLLPSKGLNAEMEAFLKRTAWTAEMEERQKTAYIIPSFEADITMTRAISRSKLLNAVEKGNVRPYSISNCYRCQSVTDYARWLALPNQSSIDIAYFVQHRSHYEPFYIAEKELLPTFDPRFRQYGSDRLSQVCEAYISGFNFAVMNNVFMVHNGFKERMPNNPIKTNQRHENKKIYETVFQEYLRSKYPDSHRTCYT